MNTADFAAQTKSEATPHISAETFAYYAGKNAAWDAIAYGETRVINPHSDATLKASFQRGARHAFAEERLNLDEEWDADIN